MAHTFKVVDDRTGETKDATLDDVAECQAQGYRIMNIGAYDAAVFEMQQEREAAQFEAQKAFMVNKSPMGDQGNKDAALMASEQYPDAKPEGDDAKIADEAQAEAKADEQATKNPDEGNFDAPDAVVDGPKPVVANRNRR